MFKRVRGSFNDYVIIYTFVKYGPFFFCGVDGEGDISRYSKVFVRLEFPLSRKQNAITLLPLFGRISRCTESIYLSYKRTLAAQS